MKRVTQTLALVAVCLLATQAASAQGYGKSLKGKFVYDGTPPAQNPLQVTKDVEFCGKHKPLDEALVVNPANKGIQNVIVFLVPGKDQKVPIHADYEAAFKEKVAFDNMKCRFEPHVAVLRTGQTISLGNKDDVAHNTKMEFQANSPENPLIPSGGALEKKYSEVERLPIPASCSIHPWMTGWLVVKDHPYVAVSDKDGAFEIKNPPAGDWEYLFWQEKAGYLNKISIDGKSPSKGRLKLTIASGKDKDCGTIKVPAASFSK